MSEAALVDAFILGLSRPGSIPAWMRREERSRGFRVVRPGDVPWLPAKDWRPDCVVSIDVNEVRLVLIHARHPGRGALTHLLAAIAAAGLKPVILEPTLQLAATLLRRGWRPTTTGSTFEDRETGWRPPTPAGTEDGR